MFRKISAWVIIMTMVTMVFAGVVLAYTGTLTATPSVTTVKAGESFDVIVKARPTLAADCIGTGGMYFQAPGTLTVANIAASITFHNAAQFSALNSALQSNGGVPPVYGDTAKVTAGTQLPGAVTYDLFKLTMSITEAGSFTFNSTLHGPGVGQDTLISCNGQEYGQTTTGFSITVVDSVISGKVTQDDGTTAISGATVKLKSGATTVATVTTGAGGTYSFTTPGPGTYTVEATPPVTTPSWTATTPTSVATAVPGDKVVNFKFISTTNVTATVLTTIPGGYSLASRPVSWQLDHSSPGTPATGSVTLGAGGSFAATIANYPGDLFIQTRGFNDIWRSFIPNGSGFVFGTATVCVDTSDITDPTGYGETGAEDLTEIALRQGSTTSTWADNNADGKVTASDYTAGLGSMGCSSNMIPPVPPLARAASSVGVAEFGLSLRRDSFGYRFALTGQSADPVSGVLVVVEKSQWDVTEYTPAEIEGFDINGSWDQDGSLMFYYERTRADDGSIPQLPLNEVTFGTGQMLSCSVGQMVADDQYPSSHMAIPRQRYETEYTGDWGTCPQGSIYNVYLPFAAR